MGNAGGEQGLVRGSNLASEQLNTESNLNPDIDRAKITTGLGITSQEIYDYVFGEGGYAGLEQSHQSTDFPGSNGIQESSESNLESLQSSRHYLENLSQINPSEVPGWFSRTFSTFIEMMPDEKQGDVADFYAFLRVVDELVDINPPMGMAFEAFQYEFWNRLKLKREQGAIDEKVQSTGSESEDKFPVIDQMVALMQNHNIPDVWMIDFFMAMDMDRQPEKYPEDIEIMNYDQDDGLVSQDVNEERYPQSNETNRGRYTTNESSVDEDRDGQVPKKIITYKSWESLEKYMRGSAGIVGLISALIMLGSEGLFEDAETSESDGKISKNYNNSYKENPENGLTDAGKAALRLGYYFQMVNFLRDIVEDVEKLGRFYVPFSDDNKKGANNLFKQIAQVIERGQASEDDDDDDDSGVLGFIRELVAQVNKRYLGEQEVEENGAGTVADTDDDITDHTPNETSPRGIQQAGIKALAGAMKLIIKALTDTYKKEVMDALATNPEKMFKGPNAFKSGSWGKLWKTILASFELDKSVKGPNEHGSKEYRLIAYQIIKSSVKQKINSFQKKMTNAQFISEFLPKQAKEMGVTGEVKRANSLLYFLGKLISRNN